ncbi:MAG TPA: tetraacyldisaccharide 4'-kinase [Steroidobacteraceae bacterium]|nr:tetraacyldisaccharide 4'-kinase [Steroidobacteraceae bacterium]
MATHGRVVGMWYRESAGAALLQPLAWLYGWIVGLRKLAYSHGWLRSLRVDKPVIVVGNLTVGGTGKTPVVAWLATQLTARGLKVGIVSRGYGRTAGRVPRIVAADSDWREVGDEPLLLRRLTGCDTVVAPDRHAGAQLLVERGADVILADDGLQHLRMARDCEIVVIDGARGFGNGRLLPAGPLREPVRRLATVRLIIVNGAAESASLQGFRFPDSATVLQMTLAGDEVVRVDGLEAPRTLESFRGERVHAVAGIGNPQRFFGELRARGLDVIEHAFADHHPFVASELSFPDGLPVLMTEKDAVRCRPLAHARLWSVPVTARFGERQSRELLESVTRSLGPTAAGR